jgi:chemotaxis protein MotB
MSVPARRRRQVFDVWPGFVDALTSLIMVMIFLLLIFAVGQAVLSDTLAVKNRALEAVGARLAELAEAAHRQDLRITEMAVAMEEGWSERDQLRVEVAEAADREKALTEGKRQLEAELARLAGQAEDAQRDLAQQAAASAALIERLNRQVAEVREQFARLSAALDLADRDSRAKDVKLAELGQQLNAALASQVGKLERYRSEFFGKLREALGSRSDVRVVGDRFVVPTDILFASGSAELDPGAEAQLAQLVATLRELGDRIPRDIDWVLRIDGHTDRLPIRTERFPSNWELSTARAVAIVKYFIAEGVPAERLSANGFGQYQPLDPADGPVAYARNRRIELQLTNR